MPTYISPYLHWCSKSSLAGTLEPSSLSSWLNATRSCKWKRKRKEERKRSTTHKEGVVNSPIHAAHQARRGRAGFGKLQVRVVSPDLCVVTLVWLIRQIEPGGRALHRLKLNHSKNPKPQNLGDFYTKRGKGPNQPRSRRQGSAHGSIVPRCARASGRMVLFTHMFLSNGTRGCRGEYSAPLRLRSKLHSPQP